MKILKVDGDSPLLQGARDLLKNETGGDAPHAWVPLNLTWEEWTAKVGGGGEHYPTHQGTLVRTERGVFACGLVGSCFAGVKRTDGSLERPDAMVSGGFRTDEVIFEYADPVYKHGCHRDATTGAIVCKCSEMW